METSETTPRKRSRRDASFPSNSHVSLHQYDSISRKIVYARQHEVSAHLIALNKACMLERLDHAHILQAARSYHSIQRVNMASHEYSQQVCYLLVADCLIAWAVPARGPLCEI